MGLLKILVLSVSLVTVVSPQSKASEIRTILTASAYGAGAGALVGLTALTFSDSPSQNISLVTRGASLGLYVGLAVGIYMATNPSDSQQAQFFVYPIESGSAVGLNFNF